MLRPWFIITVGGSEKKKGYGKTINAGAYVNIIKTI
jgi:hypothetical protein